MEAQSRRGDLVSQNYSHRHIGLFRGAPTVGFGCWLAGQGYYQKVSCYENIAFVIAIQLGIVGLGCATVA